jgi:hypothetical protein
MPPPTPGWLVALAVILTGGGLAFLALRAGGLSGGRLARYTAACAPGLGLGLASLLLFFWRTLGGGGSARPGLAAYLVTAAVLGLGIQHLGARFGRAAEPAPSPAPPPRPLVRGVRWGAWLAFGASAAAVAVSFWVISHAWPLGTWDAVAIWNVKARFLFRGYGEATDLLKRVDPSSHPNYPLLVPGAVAAQWSMAGGEDPWTAPLTGLAFLAGLGLMVLAVAADSGLPAFGAVAAAFVWINPMVLKWGGAQGADLAVGYCFLAALAVMSSRLPGREGAGLPPLLGGVFLGLLAWSKNEGTLTLLILLGLYGLWAWLHAWGRREVWRDAVMLTAGAVPGLAAVFLFKSRWAPESGLATFLQGRPLDRILSLERWFVPVREILKRLIPVEAGIGWSVAWPAVLAGALLAVWVHLRRRRPWASFWAAAVAAVVGSWVPIFAITPYGQMWHIEGSLDRLYLQVFPAVVAGICLQLGLAVAASEVEEVRWRDAAAPVRRKLSALTAGAGWLAALVVAGLAVKAFVVAAWLPRIWLFLDELFYLVTAWDLGHWGSPGVPHPDFLFYPPLTSALLTPFLVVGFKPPLAYHLGMLLFHALLTSSAVAAWLLMRRLFGESSRLLPCVLLFGPPAYTALALMSEPVFVSVYTWFLYLWVRAVQDRRARYAWMAGFLLAGLVLTRFAGYLAAGCLALGAVADFAFRRDRRSLKLHLIALVPPLVTALLWRTLGTQLRPETTQSPLFMLAIVVNFPLEMVLGTARRLMAEIGYVSLSTYGFALPAALWGLARRSDGSEAGETGEAGERTRVRRLFLLNLLTFLVLACGIAALFMWFAHFLSYLPRFDLYGRYVEYFAIPLLVVAFGVIATVRRQASARERAALSLAALALNTLLLLFVPVSFFTASLNNQVAPNSLGIAWLLRLVGEAGTWSRWLAPVLAALLVWGLTGRGWLRRAAGGVLVLLTVLNFSFAVREASVNSTGSAVYNSLISDYVSANPEPFAKGLYVDYPDYLRDTGQEAAADALAYRVIADHVDQVVVGRRPGEQLGTMPVLTKRVFDRPVLMEWPGVPYRIYAADPPAAQPAP